MIVVPNQAAETLVRGLDAEFNPCGDIAPGLHYMNPTSVAVHFGAGEFINIDHFRMSAESQGMAPGRGTVAYAKYLARLTSGLPLQHKILSAASNLAHNPDEGIRFRLGFRTDKLASLVTSHESGAFDKRFKIFTRLNWSVISGVVQIASVNPFADLITAPVQESDFMWDD